MSTVSIHISERIATITLNRPKSLNSISTEGSHLVTLAIDFSDFTLSLTLDYDAFANALREIDAREEVLVTVWQGASLPLLIIQPESPLLKLEDSYWELVLRVRSSPPFILSACLLTSNTRGTDVKRRSKTYDPNESKGSALRNNFRATIVSATTDCGKAVRRSSISKSSLKSQSSCVRSYTLTVKFLWQH